ncbi:MAG: GHKL domain-containing protein [Nitrospirae bacterium]|nr:GHKL domain-containing protein [Nitrospirota bacterium]
MSEVTTDPFTQIFMGNKDAIVLLRRDNCTVIDANPAAALLFGIAAGQLAGTNLLSLIEMGGPRKIPDKPCWDEVNKILCSGMRVYAKKSVGSQTIVSLHAIDLDYHGEKAVYCKLRNISETYRIEEETRSIYTQLMYTNKMTALGTLASGIAHEINNPNNYILFNARILLDTWPDMARILQEYYSENGDFSVGGLPFSEMSMTIPDLLSAILDGGERISAIVSNLKDFARQDSAAPSDDVDINDAVNRAVSILSHKIRKTTSHFNSSLDESIPPVRGSRHKIEQVIVNLLMNALEAISAREQTVSISTAFEPASDSIVIRVSDCGAGIPAEMIDRVTEPFFTTKLNQGGSGLGLYISYSIVREHGGEMKFESEAGRGTIVTVTLPATDRHSIAAESAHA